jgi:hypothetical protein
VNWFRCSLANNWRTLSTVGVPSMTKSPCLRARASSSKFAGLGRHLETRPSRAASRSRPGRRSACGVGVLQGRVGARLRTRAQRMQRVRRSRRPVWHQSRAGLVGDCLQLFDLAARTTVGEARRVFGIHRSTGVKPRNAHELRVRGRQAGAFAPGCPPRRSRS